MAWPDVGRAVRAHGRDGARRSEAGTLGPRGGAWPAGRCTGGGHDLPAARQPMLVLTRKADETLIFELPDGERITVTITALDGRRARLSIDAPWSVRVLHGELDGQGQESRADGAGMRASSAAHARPRAPAGEVAGLADGSAR